MFTGIVDHIGRIVDIADGEQSRQLTIETQFDDIILGESIAIDGVCLTAMHAGSKQFQCILSSETLRLTKAGQYRIGDAVNVERALAVGDRMGGHQVNGHVDGMWRIAACQMLGDCCELELEGMTSEQQAWVSRKGSISVDGVSLTINALTETGVRLMLIPQTLSLTTLSESKAGDAVHVEFDPIAKLVARQFDLMKQQLLQQEMTHVN